MTAYREPGTIDTTETECARIREEAKTKRKLIEESSADALWFSASEFPEDFDLYEGIAETMKEPSSWAFATKVFPRFQQLLREELAAEAAQSPSP